MPDKPEPPPPLIGCKGEAGPYKPQWRFGSRWRFPRRFCHVGPQTVQYRTIYIVRCCEQMRLQPFVCPSAGGLLPSMPDPLRPWQQSHESRGYCYDMMGQHSQGEGLKAGLGNAPQERAS